MENHFEFINQVKNVSTLRLEYIKKYWWISLPLLVIGIFLLKFGWDNNNGKLLNVGVITLCAEIFTIIMGIIFADQQARKVFMKMVASALKFSYKEYGVVGNTKAELFKIGNRKEITHFLEGEYQNMPVSLYNYKSVTGSGKNIASYRYTVFEVIYPFEIPRVILLKKSILNERCMLSDKVVVKLEGNFNKYFELYTQEKFEKDIRVIFTPDVIAFLIDEAPNINFEMCDNKIYIYEEKFITKKDDLHLLYKTTQMISVKLQSNLETFSRISK